MRRTKTIEWETWQSLPPRPGATGIDGNGRPGGYCDYYDARAPSSIKESINNGTPREWDWDWDYWGLGCCARVWGNWLLSGSRQDQSARHGQNKMYANGLINYEISSVGYVRLLKGSTAGWSILHSGCCCLRSHSSNLSLSFSLSWLG